MNKVLITGGAGYIGSHTVVKFIEADYEVVVLDDLSNSSSIVFDRIETITGKRPEFVHGNIGDVSILNDIFSKHEIDGVIHFAGFKAVGESVAEPLKYYSNNVSNTVVLCEQMRQHNCKKFVFSSSATVYGDPGIVAYTEDLPLSPVNPYGQTKRMVEDILRDQSVADKSWSIALLRYFNPVGAHESGLIGEDPKGIPNNLMPYIAKVAVGELEALNVFGDDYSTIDGTGVRDYIHVEDLAEGHLAAYRALSSQDGLGSCQAYNLGTGKGCSVLEVVDAFSKASGRDIPYNIQARRSGDLAEYYAVPGYTEKALGWIAKYDINDMVRDHWNWQKSNPSGYEN